MKAFVIAFTALIVIRGESGVVPPAGAADSEARKLPQAQLEAIADTTAHSNNAVVVRAVSCKARQENKHYWELSIDSVIVEVLKGPATAGSQLTLFRRLESAVESEREAVQVIAQDGLYVLFFNSPRKDGKSIDVQEGEMFLKQPEIEGTVKETVKMHPKN